MLLCFIRTLVTPNDVTDEQYPRMSSLIIYTITQIYIWYSYPDIMHSSLRILLNGDYIIWQLVGMPINSAHNRSD